MGRFVVRPLPTIAWEASVALFSVTVWFLQKNSLERIDCSYRSQIVMTSLFQSHSTSLVLSFSEPGYFLVQIPQAPEDVQTLAIGCVSYFT